MSAVTAISPVTKINASDESQRLDLIELFWLYLFFFCLTVYNIPFIVANLDSSLFELFKKRMIFCISILYET